MLNTNKIRLVNPQNGYANKVSIVKSVRYITECTLKEAVDVVNNCSEQFLVFPLYKLQDPSALKELEQEIQSIRSQGGDIGDSVHTLLNNLRQIGAEALKQGEDELANEILQLVLAEKLRRKE